MSDDPEVIDPMNWLEWAVKNRRCTIRWRVVLPIALGVDAALLMIVLVILRLAGVLQ
jgi:hypothetical protein